VNPDYVVRKARPTDLPMVYKGELNYIRTIEPEHEQRWKDAMHAHLRQWTAALERMSVVEQDGVPLGYCFWESIDGAACLASIHVAPELRQRGLGRLLLDHYMDDARAQGFTRLTLSVFRGNPAQFLYESAGFQRVSEGAEYLGYEYPEAALNRASMTFIATPDAEE
jgi:ribosomal protein S18 acetylase RimI-like enzyme